MGWGEKNKKERKKEWPCWKLTNEREEQIKQQTNKQPKGRKKAQRKRKKQKKTDKENKKERIKEYCIYRLNKGNDDEWTNKKAKKEWIKLKNEQMKKKLIQK